MHVVSTAGHVDHGKSTLIEKLTGIDPDRLAEEKQRGLTIDLGFAWLTLPTGREVGIVDVPGHERFIHNMLAGVGSVDATIFVVAANEGWKPQSEEHLQILEMLGARAAVVALTKSDLVDADVLEQRRAQIAGRLEGTPLEAAEIIPVSTVNGTGLVQLQMALDRLLDGAGAPDDAGRPRVFVDRAFTVNGVGTVITGTLTGGRLAIDAPVMVLPAGHRTRIRGIQTHRRVLEEAVPVSRVALNLAGLERAGVRRGDAIVLPAHWAPTTDLDVSLRAVRSLDHEITSRGSFKVYVGSAEIDCRLSLYETEALKPGHDAFARLTLTHPVVAAPHDRFVLRDAARRQTVGGGTILDAHPPTLRGTARAARPAQLHARAQAKRDDIPTLLVAERGLVPRADLEHLTGSAAPPRDAVALRTLEVSQTLYDDIARAITTTLETFHRRAPLVRGLPRDDLREAAQIKNARLFVEMLDAVAGIVCDGPLVRLTTHAVTLTLEQEAARDILLQQLRDARFMPPGVRSLEDTHGAPLVRALIEGGALIQLTEDIVLTGEQLEEAKHLITAATQASGPLTTSQIREILGTSRKYAIPLLEYLDRAGFTRRSGEVRELV